MLHSSVTGVSLTYGSSFLGTKECLQEEAKLLIQESDCLANTPNSKKSQSDFEVLGEKSIVSSSSNSVGIQHPKSELNNANTQCLSSYKKGTQQYRQHHDSFSHLFSKVFALHSDLAFVPLLGVCCQLGTLSASKKSSEYNRGKELYHHVWVDTVPRKKKILIKLLWTAHLTQTAIYFIVSYFFHILGNMSSQLNRNGKLSKLVSSKFLCPL